MLPAILFNHYELKFSQDFTNFIVLNLPPEEILSQ